MTPAQDAERVFKDDLYSEFLRATKHMTFATDSEKKMREILLTYFSAGALWAREYSTTASAEDSQVET